MLATSLVSLGVALATAADPAVVEAPRWRFKDDDRPIKVVVLAGSIGAWKRRPYARRIEMQCANVEVKNVSEAGLGSWALKKRFEQQVLANRKLDLKAQGQQFWLIYGGGLNTVWDPDRNNHHAKNTFVKAHMAGFKVLGLSVTPWGADGDKRWKGPQALVNRKATQKIVDFVMGRLTPQQALGKYADRRPAGASGPWDPLETPDLAIDVYDSILRNADAAARDEVESRTVLERDAGWKRTHRNDDPERREAALAADAKTLAESPRWYMREELHSFDHIHPNEEGHRLIAAVMCPNLPEDWGCRCDGSTAAATSKPDAAMVDRPPAGQPTVDRKEHLRSPPPRFPNLRGCVRQ